MTEIDTRIQRSFTTAQRMCDNPVEHDFHAWTDTNLGAVVNVCAGKAPDMPMCACGEPYALGIVHLRGMPCFLPENAQTPVRTPLGIDQASDMLGEIFERQEYFQRLLGHDYVEMTTEQRVGYLKDQILALLDESHEALNEMGWKPWASSRHLNVEEFRGELVDILCFLVNLALGVGMTATDFHSLHEEKALRNIKRQEAKYDGLTGKCPVCKRALDDLIAKGISTQVSFLGREYCSQSCVTTYRTMNQEN